MHNISEYSVWLHALHPTQLFSIRKKAGSPIFRDNLNNTNQNIALHNAHMHAKKLAQ